MPGAGNGHEVIYLVEEGFTDITVVDISIKAIENLKSRINKHSSVKLIHGDYFNHQGSYDLILEQTFFCAIQPILRKKYVEHSHNLLKVNGCIVGLLFNVEFNREGPPFGGSEPEYRSLFKPYFHIKYCDPCYNSIPPRRNTELFIKMIRNS